MLNYDFKEDTHFFRHQENKHFVQFVQFVQFGQKEHKQHSVAGVL